MKPSGSAQQNPSLRSLWILNTVRVQVIATAAAGDITVNTAVTIHPVSAGQGNRAVHFKTIYFGVCGPDCETNQGRLRDRGLNQEISVFCHLLNYSTLDLLTVYGCSVARGANRDGNQHLAGLIALTSTDHLLIAGRCVICQMVKAANGT